MDFFEQWFGIHPDGGSGATELLYFIAVAALIFAVYLAPRIPLRVWRIPRRWSEWLVDVLHHND